MAATALAAAVACGVGHNAGSGGTGADSAHVPDVVRPATLAGCIARGDRPGEIVLIALGYDGVPSSSTAGFAWQGTRQYSIVLPGQEPAQVAVAQRVTVSGTIVDPPGRGPDRLDQEQAAYGTSFREFHVSSLQPANGPCRRTIEYGRDTAP
jgi:hypothetical protein